MVYVCMHACMDGWMDVCVCARVCVYWGGGGRLDATPSGFCKWEEKRLDATPSGFGNFGKEILYAVHSLLAEC